MHPFVKRAVARYSACALSDVRGWESGAATVWQTARMEPVLVACGLAATAIGMWRGYVNARAVVAPVVHAGDATRTAVEATGPVPERARVRRAARNLVVAIAWLVMAMYGLFLLTTAGATG